MIIVLSVLLSRFKIIEQWHCINCWLKCIFPFSSQGLNRLIEQQGNTVSVFPLPFMKVYLQYGYSNRGTWNIIQITMDFENKRFLSFIANGPITFMNFRALSWEVRWVQTVLVFNGCIVEPCILVVHLLKNLRIFCFQKMLWLDNLLLSAPVWIVTL